MKLLRSAFRAYTGTAQRISKSLGFCHGRLIVAGQVVDTSKPTLYKLQLTGCQHV